MLSSESSLAVIILTKDESLHISRCLDSIKNLTAAVYIIDSGSSDQTVNIASSYGAFVVFNKWINYSSQFSFGLSILPDTTKWVLRLDADEYFDESSIANIKSIITNNTRHNGFYCSRRIIFLGSPLRYGGIGSVKTLRLFRFGQGTIESRWMDEHVYVPGPIGTLGGILYDHNLRTLSWWIDKHNSYASREAVDVILSSLSDTIKPSIPWDLSSVSLKRFIKVNIYPLIPIPFRALFFFLFRYFVLLGFLDGYSGLAFHFLQCYWYRHLVDFKVNEVLMYSRQHQITLSESIYRVLGINVTSFDSDYSDK